jgi:hypothetical protein
MQIRKAAADPLLVRAGFGPDSASDRIDVNRRRQHMASWVLRPSLRFPEN